MSSKHDPFFSTRTATGTTIGSLVRSYTWGLDILHAYAKAGGVAALLQITDHPTGKAYLPMYDANGNVAALLNADTGTVAVSYEYSPYGEVIRKAVMDSTIADSAFGFSTKATDAESGLVYYGDRYYAPAVGRFISRDTIEENGGENQYGFVENDPINRWDLLGNAPSTTAWRLVLGLGYDTSGADDEPVQARLVVHPNPEPDNGSMGSTAGMGALDTHRPGGIVESGGSLGGANKHGSSDCNGGNGSAATNAATEQQENQPAAPPPAQPQGAPQGTTTTPNQGNNGGPDSNPPAGPTITVSPNINEVFSYPLLLSQLPSLEWRLDIIMQLSSRRILRRERKSSHVVAQAAESTESKMGVSILVLPHPVDLHLRAQPEMAPQGAMGSEPFLARPVFGAAAILRTTPAGWQQCSQ